VETASLSECKRKLTLFFASGRVGVLAGTQFGDDGLLQQTKQDVVIIIVTVQGHRSGVLSQESYAHKIYHQDIDGEHWGAIQVTTAAGI